MKNIIIIGAGDQVSNLAHLIAKQGFNVTVTEVPNREHTYNIEREILPELILNNIHDKLKQFEEYKDGRTLRRENRKKNRKKNKMEDQEKIQKLTKKIAISEVSYIHHISGDDEVAHSSEDDLHKWFIECVAANLYDSIEEMVEVANIVKSTSEIDFNRWYA